MNYCSTFPCQRTSAGCPVCDMKPGMVFSPIPIPPVGCICPPTSEQTCRSPVCGRKPRSFSGSSLGASVPEIPPVLSDAQIKHMVDRFLMWKLPEGFNPDGGISFENTTYRQQNRPVGTNLFSATEAEAMVRHMIEGVDQTEPDWPPAASAIGLADGVRRHGSTGQCFEVKQGRWERVR